MFGASSITDDLVKAAAAGSTDASDRLFKQLMPQVRAMIIARLAPSRHQLQVVDDLCQQTLTGVAEGLPGLEICTAAGLKAFVSTIVSRRVIDFIRRTPQRGHAGAPTGLDSAYVEASTMVPKWMLLAADDTTPSSKFGRGEAMRRVLAEMASLKPEHREIVTLAFFDQLTTAEIAERLELSRSAAGMLLLRAVRTLKRRLAGNRPSVSDRKSTDEP